VSERRSPYAVKHLLQEHGVTPRKRWGQNFLCDPNTARRIADIAELQPNDRVVEIGPGAGALTLRLAERCAFVTAFELDMKLVPVLAETLGGLENVRLRFTDFMEADLGAELDEAFGTEPGVVVANIPYYITTPIIERLLAHGSRMRRILLLVQREYAHRLAALPGSENCSALSAFAQYHAKVELRGTVPPSVFFPPPDVTSEIVALTPVPGGTVQVEDEAAFFATIRAAFGQRRKALPNALAGGLADVTREAATAALERAGINPARRGETLTLVEFARLAAEMRR
jgi:16S rRNA (adenine1518-N6/adenine1519-N6)-dimethyltransferase